MYCRGRYSISWGWWTGNLSDGAIASMNTPSICQVYADIILGKYPVIWAFTIDEPQKYYYCRSNPRSNCNSKLSRIIRTGYFTCLEGGDCQHEYRSSPSNRNWKPGQRDRQYMLCISIVYANMILDSILNSNEWYNERNKPPTTWTQSGH